MLPPQPSNFRSELPPGSPHCLPVSRGSAFLIVCVTPKLGPEEARAEPAEHAALSEGLAQAAAEQVWNKS